MLICVDVIVLIFFVAGHDSHVHLIVDHFVRGPGHHFLCKVESKYCVTHQSSLIEYKRVCPGGPGEKEFEAKNSSHFYVRTAPVLRCLDKYPEESFTFRELIEARLNKIYEQEEAPFFLP